MFTELISVCAIGSFGASFASNYKEPKKYVSLNNQATPKIVNINYDETLFYPFTVSVDKCGGNNKIKKSKK